MYLIYLTKGVYMYIFKDISVSEPQVGVSTI